MSLNLRKLFCNLKIFARKRGYVTFVPKTPMKTILGPFHPHLENALVEEIRGQKADNPLLPVLILVPSDSLRRRLKILLTREQNLSLVNLQLLTFHQLSSRLSSEVNGVNLPILRDDLFLEEVLRQIIRTKQPGTEAFAGIEERAGGCAALWQTLRDLRDGMVEPSVVLEALREGHFAARTSERTSHLLALLQTLRLFCKEKGIEDHSDLEKLTTERAPLSCFLSQFAQIFYYGFYDLTQIQVDLFHSIVQNYPATLFLPAPADAAEPRGLEFRRALLPTLRSGPNRRYSHDESRRESCTPRHFASHFPAL